MNAINVIQQKPHYSLHRLNVNTADTSDLSQLLDDRESNTVAARGFDSLHGMVELEGTASTVTLQPIELIRWKDKDGIEQKRFVVRGSNIGPLNSGALFEYSCEGGGRFFFRIEALGGTDPVLTNLLLAGGKRSNQGGL